MNRKAGICMVLGAYWPEISGGAIQCFNLVESLKDDYEFYIISTFNASKQPHHRRKIFTEESIGKTKVFRISHCPGEMIFKFVSLLAVFIIFFKLKDRVGIFHMHGFTRKSYLIALLAKIFGKKIIVKTTSFGIDDPLSVTKRHFIASGLYSLADSYILTSPAQLESYKHSGLSGEKAILIPNGVNLKKFSIPSHEEKMYLRKELGIPELSQVILSVSFFSRDKGLDVFADSLSLLPKDKLNNLFLIFIGSKDCNDIEVEEVVVKKVYDIIDCLKLRPRTIFIDSTLEIEKYFKVSDIFVLPSKREGLPNALLEAMASGLCCIANRVNGSTDYLIKSNENGYLFDNLNTHSIAETLNMAIGNKEIQGRFGNKARLRIEEEFDMDKIKEKYTELYMGLLTGAEGIKNKPTDFKKKVKKTEDVYGFLWRKSKDEKSGKWHYNNMQEVIKEPIVRGQKGIDIGSGCGYDTLIMAKNNPLVKIISLDISEGVYKTKKLTSGLSNVWVLKGSALNIPIADNSLDFAYSFGVLHHTSDPDSAVREISRVVKKSAPAYLYLYEDHSENRIKYALLKFVKALRIVTTKIPSRVLYALSFLASPFVVIVFTLPYRALSRFKATRELSEKIPFNFGTNLFSLTGDIYDRFGAPIERRFGRREAFELLSRNGFSGISICRMKATAGWVASGSKR